MSNCFEPLALAAGRRSLPDWARGAHINWMDGYDNRPHLHIRCSRDPLEFSKAGAAVWDRFDCLNYLGKKSRGYIAECDGAAAVHYHDGAVALTPFQERVGWINGKFDPQLQDTLDGGPRVDRAGCWPDQPGRPSMGGGIYETRQILATTQQEGYAGRHIDITLKSGELFRLRGPWHGGAPEGFIEVYYYIDRLEDQRRGRWWRPWYNRGGFFGLYVRTELLLDIFATFQPHIAWCTVTEVNRFGESHRLEPMRPETALPKGWHVSPEDCPGHRYGMTSFQGGPHPGDRCTFCEQRRDPDWVSPYDKRAAA